MKYPERIQHLVLASPAGVGKRPLTEERHRRKSLFYSSVNFLWNKKFGPQSIIRGSGRFGPRLVGAYTNARFSYLSPLEKELLKDYTYHINAGRGSGEFALNVLFNLGVQSRNPLVDRARNIRVPTTFIYGSHDWMRVEDGREASVKINSSSHVLILKQAGHHVFLDNPQGFNRLILDIVEKSY